MKQSEKLTQLLELMQANPELPVIPCVDGDVVSGDEYYLAHGERARFRSSSSAEREPTTGRTIFQR